jgi:hypothetical protein
MTAARGLRARALVGAVAAALVACDVDGDDAAFCASIVGGWPDRAHDAVAALVNGWNELVCTGTLVGRAADGSPAVLTAAHCLDDDITAAVFGEDYLLAPSASGAVALRIPHPLFDVDTGEFDFALLIIDGEIANLRPLPMARSEDGIATGTAILFVGFGDTGEISGVGARAAVAGTVGALTKTSFEYDQSAGGPCFGDSGGPALVTAAGRTTIVGVTSHGLGGGCLARGASARLSAARPFVDSFVIDPSPDHCPPER